ncbi:cyclic lactone autoinducer peptide [Lysinibacillus mangiferihumi]|uniref:Cyclic lactone autoinducer peptide n=1 Tax=Lysinibacillus mangiferihumi TaxID=1130819 RepID=A0A4U2Z7C4_9BACI|nr:cyclic lactone autoinducer peptide [Lysinibacillus mangiferihumi]TKI69775.1 cyclic lactone autoinducer peptide [Lysinibacillus mangiferihumi]
MKFIIDKVVGNLCDLLIKLADFGSVYMCWGAIGEEELPQELKLDKFEKKE